MLRNTLSILIMTLGIISVTNSQTPCPDGATITANDKCVFLSWEVPPDPLPATIVVEGSEYTYQSGDGTNSDLAIFRDGTPGGGACNANQSNVFTGDIIIDGEACTFIDGQLGVEWLSFDIERFRNEILISWSVIADEFHDRFEIERSMDLATWQVIAVEYQKSIYQEQNYLSRDIPAMSGQYYYRIKQVDGDGKTDYSPILAIEYLTSSNISIAQNISGGKSYIKGMDSMINYSIQLFTIDGRILRYEQIIGETEYEFDYSEIGLPRGIYILSISSGVNRHTGKLVIQ